MNLKLDATMSLLGGMKSNQLFPSIHCKPESYSFREDCDTERNLVEECETVRDLEEEYDTERNLEEEIITE